MSQLVNLSLLFISIFFVTAVVAYIVTAVAEARRRPPVPEVGTVFRLRATQSMYRTRFLGVRNGCWAFSAPLSRNAYVPMHAGEKLIAEAGLPNGVLLFRTEVVSRSLHDHSFEVRPPTDSRVKDRREEPRVALPYSEPVLIERCTGRALDLSSCGIRVETTAHLRCGERVRIDLPGEKAPIFGWVLAIDQGIARIRFEERISVSVL